MGVVKCFDAQVNSIEPSETLFVTGEHNLVLSGLLNANAIVRERLRRVEVEDEKNSGTLEDDLFIDVVLQGHMCLYDGMSSSSHQWTGEARVTWGAGKPLVFGLQVVHGFVEVVQVPVAKYGIINDVPLPTGVVERVVVSSTREIEPLNARIVNSAATFL